MNNQTMIQYFEWNLPCDQNHWNYIAAHAHRIKELGFTLAWLPPAYKGANGAEDVGYGVYDLYDLGEFDQRGSVATKYGTRAEYLKAVNALKADGIRVITDVVLNQMLGADGTEPVYATPVDYYDRERKIGEAKEIQAYTRFDFSARAGQYSNFTWHWNQFSGVDCDAATGEVGIFLFSGKEWNKPVDTEFVNFDYLMGADLDMDDTCTREQLIHWGKWYIDTVGPDGFRLDAVKHIKFYFMKDWVREMRSYMLSKGWDDVFVVGEYWSGDIGKLRHYIHETEGDIRLFDVPLHFNFVNAANSKGLYDLRQLLDNTLLKEDPDHAVTFVDNHDTQPGESLQSWVQSWFKPLAYGIILLMKNSIPCVFFGDYRGMPHDSTAPAAALDELLLLRKNRAYGDEHLYFDHPNVVGLTREGDDAHENSGLAMLLSDSTGGEKRMYIGEKFAGRTFIDYLGNVEESVVISDDGHGIFKCQGGSISVWVPEGTLSEEEIANRTYRIEHGIFNVIAKKDVEPLPYEAIPALVNQYVEDALIREQAKEAVAEEAPQVTEEENAEEVPQAAEEAPEAEAGEQDTAAASKEEAQPEVQAEQHE